MLTLDEQIARLADHAEAAATASATAVPDLVVEHDAGRRRSPLGRPWVLAAAASVVAIGIAAVAVAPRWVEPDDPFGTVPEPTQPTQPGVVPTSAVPSTSVLVTEPADGPALPPSDVPRPTRFPALAATDPRDAGVTATYGFRSVGPGNGVASSTALVGEQMDEMIDGAVIDGAVIDGAVIDGAVVEGVMVSVLEAPVPPDAGSDEIDPVTVAGRTYDAWRAEGGSPVLTTLVDRDDPRISVTGRDPAAFLDRLGVPPVVGITSVGGVVEFELSPLPAGWTVIVPPTSAPPQALVAGLTLSPAEGVESDYLGVGLIPELPLVGTGQRLRRVDIDGTEGWTPIDAPFTVYWPAGDGVFAWAFSPTADGALALARSVEFVDEATWRERYDVGPDDMPIAAT